MEDTLTNHLINIRDDLSQLKRVREYLDSQKQSQGNCLLTWRTMEAFNSILSVCNSQDTPEVDALNIIIDSFHHVAAYNNEESAWTDFGYELGVISFKILSAIERTDKFEVLFCKLLTVINSICEHNSNVWKAVARPILNVLINKRFPFEYLETILKIYLTILRRIEDFVLHSFALQNLGHLKTLSLLIEDLGDYETQMDIMELIFLHTSDKKLLDGFFTNSRPKIRDLFQILHFVDFESDCRIFLNALNKELPDRKIFSICCNMLSFGGCFVEPPAEGKQVWLDANKDSERLSLKCSDFQSDTPAPQIIFIKFSNLLAVQLEKQTKNPGSYCVSIKTKHLDKIQKGTKNSDILCIALESDNEHQAVVEFVDFLKEILMREKKRKKVLGKLSRTLEEICIERDSGKEVTVQDDAISSSVFDKDKTTFSQSSWETKKTPIKPLQDNTHNRNIVLETQELTPNSFVESLNRNIGISPEVRHSFEDSVQTVNFFQNSSKKTHTLFRSPEVFHFLEPDPKPEFDFLFQNKENEPPTIKPLSEKKKKWPIEQSTRVLRKKKQEPILTNSQSQDYFHKVNTEKKKPMMPKLKKKKCISTKKKSTAMKHSRKSPKKCNQEPKASRPSLLDPNGYAYQRWLKPTTSERSNFWLKKLDKVQKSKAKSDHVFDFTEESDSDVRWKAKTRSIQKPKKPKKKVNEPLKEVKDILKTSLFKFSPKIITSPRRSPRNSPKEQNTPQEPISPNPISSPDPVVESPPLSTIDKISEINELSELSEDDAKTQKRLRSEEENSLTRCVIKKKPKTYRDPVKSFPFTLQNRILKVEEKARHQTEEIIQTVNKATDHLLDHIWRKQAEKMASYINSAEEVAIEVQENEDLKNATKRIEKVMTYFEAGCSVSRLCATVENELTKMKTSWMELMEKRVDAATKINRINNHLKNLIVTEIDRSIQNEMETRKMELGNIVNSRCNS